MGVERDQSEPQQLLWSVEGCAGFLVLELDCLVHHFRPGCHYVPPLDSPAGDQRGSWVNLPSTMLGAGANCVTERASVAAARVSEHERERCECLVAVWRSSEDGTAVTERLQSTGSNFQDVDMISSVRKRRLRVSKRASDLDVSSMFPILIPNSL